MKSRSGFTLIELMVVVGIMILIGSIVVTGSFGMSRASSYLAAENVVYNTLQAARQKACTDGKRVIVAFVRREEENGDGANYSMVTVQAAGKISKVGNVYFYDRGSLMDQYSGARNVKDSVWNLTTGGSAAGPFTIKYLERQVSPEQIPRFTGRFGYDVTEIRFEKALNGKLWHEGDTYGFQVGEMQELPLGFKFGFGSTQETSSEGQLIVFEPDGRSFYGEAKSTGISQNNPANLYLYEEVARDKAIQIVVDNGSVTVVAKKQ